MLDADHLQREGWLRVENAVPRTLCDRLVEVLERKLDVPVRDPSRYMGDLVHSGASGASHRTLGAGDTDAAEPTADRTRSMALMRFLLIALATIFAATAVAQPRDARTELRPGSASWGQFGDVLDAIGVVSHVSDDSRSHAGSAFVVGRCHALTSRRAASAGDESARPGPLTFSAGYTGNPQTPWKLSTRATVVAVAFGQGPSADWALLRLAHCDARYPRVELGRMDEFDLAGGLIHALGFEAARGAVRLMAHLNCNQLWHRAHNRFSMTCAVGKGQSGGPVLVQWGPQRTWVAIGITTREALVDADTTRVEDANPYTSIGPVLSDIEAAIREDFRRNPPR